MIGILVLFLNLKKKRLLLMIDYELLQIVLWMPISLHNVSPF